MSLLFPARVVPKGAILIGFAFILGAAGLAVSHFVYGQPVYGRHSHRPVSTGAVIFSLILFATAGCVLAGLGITALRAPRRRAREAGEE
jgi:hypothetical protein